MSELEDQQGQVETPGNINFPKLGATFRSSEYALQKRLAHQQLHQSDADQYEFASQGGTHCREFQQTQRTL